MLPAGTIDRVDWNEEKVYVDRTKDQIKDSPEFDESTMVDDPAHRAPAAVVHREPGGRRNPLPE
jgi:hypothetical protein